MNCSNLCVRGSGFSFYTFPADLDQRNKWIAAVNKKNWYPTEHMVICSEHFIDGQKSNNQFAPNYTPTIFQHVDSPMKRKIEAQVADFRRTASRKWRIEQTEITDQQKKKAKESRMQELAEASKRQEEEEQRLKEIEEQQRLEEERKRREEDERERLLREEERREAEQRKEIEDAKQKRLDEMNRLQQAEETRLEYDELLKKYDDLLLKYNQAVEELEQLRTREAKLNTKVDELQTRIVSQQSLEEND